MLARAESTRIREYPVKKEEFPFWSARIEKAYEIGRKAHEGQKRITSGEDYFNHCVAVAGIIENWVYVGESLFVEDLVCAGLLHDTIEDTVLTIDDIRREFGGEVAFLVDGVSKFKSKGENGTDHETIRKVLAGYYVDPRVVLLKLADRVQNMETLGEMPVERREPKAWETEEIYARMAKALGMWEVMKNLKDAAFPFRFPERYKYVSEVMEGDLRRNPEYIDGICSMVKQIVEATEIKAEVGFRMAGLRQIDQKRRRLNRPTEKCGYESVSDVLSIGITVSNIDECYRLLGIIRGKLGYQLDPQKSSDTIAYPADNGYRALKEVVDLGFGAVELVIMTKEIEDFNNWGVVSLIRRGLEDLSNYRMKIVFTPDGEIRILPTGATGWDVAAEINPELAKRMTALTVDGRNWLPSVSVPHTAEVKIIAGRGDGIYLEDNSWTNCSLPATKKILRSGLEGIEYRRIVAKGTILSVGLLAKRGVISFYDIRDEIMPRLSELGCSSIGELLFGIGSGEISGRKLDKVLDQGDQRIDKKSLGYSTVLVKGSDEAGILHCLSGVINEIGGNIVRVVNQGDGVTFEIRIVVKGLTTEQEKELKNELTADNKYAEVLVV